MPFGVEIEGEVDELLLYAGAALLVAGMLIIYFLSGNETYVVVSLVIMFLGAFSVAAAVISFISSQGSEGSWM